MMQAGGFSNLGRAHEIFGGSVRWTIHLVIFVESRYVPRNFGRYRCNKLSQALQFMFRIVEARYQQCDNFEPNLHRMKPLNGVQDRANTSAHFVIVPVIKALEIDLV